MTLSIKIQVYILLCLITLSIATSQSYKAQSQTRPTNAQLTKQFRDGFTRGCLKGKTEGAKDQKKYCICMANSYQSRYDGRTLSAISQIAGSLGEKGPALVNLMISPEARICKSKTWSQCECRYQRCCYRWFHLLPTMATITEKIRL